MTVPSSLSNLNLTTFNKIYPLLIQKYNTLVPDPNANILDKINSIIDYLNSVGSLSNEVVDNWNKVMSWTMNDGLTTDVNNKIEAMNTNGEFNSVLTSLFNAEIGDLTTLTTNDKSKIVNAINEVEANTKSNASSLAQNASKITNTSKVIALHNKWKPLAKDNFADTSNFNFVFSDGTAAPTWTVANNQLTSPTGQTKDGFAFFKGVNLNDGRVQVIIENVDASQPYGTYAGLALRAKSLGDTLAVIIQSNGGGGGVLELWHLGTANGASNTMITNAGLTTNDVIIQTNVPISLEVEIIGLTVKAYVNGHLMLTYTDTDLSTPWYLYGLCGIVASANKAWTFSNFSMRSRRFDLISPNIKTVVCIGSSITNGYKNLTPWPNRFKTRLDAEFANNPVTMVNGGVPGDTNFYMLTRIDDLINNNHPDVVVIENSINDQRSDVFTDFNKTLQDLRMMIKKVKQSGAIPLLTTATPINPNVNNLNFTPVSWQRIPQINVRVRQLAMEEEILLIENADIFSNDMTYILDDDVHPNDFGAQTMADTAFNTIIGLY